MKCNHCGDHFVAQRRTRKFCSGACREAYRFRLKRELERTEWHSPAEIVEAAHAVMGGIDLDPASCAQANEIVKAKKFYSLREDGLKQPWFGRVWLNPPYGRFAPMFVKRFGELFSAGGIEQGILLLGTHHLTTEWFGASLAWLKPIICFPGTRLKFSDSKSRPAHGSAILGVGVDKEEFRKVFSEFGYLFNAIPQDAKSLYTVILKKDHP